MVGKKLASFGNHFEYSYSLTTSQTIIVVQTWNETRICLGSTNGTTNSGNPGGTGLEIIALVSYLGILEMLIDYPRIILGNLVPGNL